MYMLCFFFIGTFITFPMQPKQKLSKLECHHMVPSYILLMLASKKTIESKKNHINFIACQFHAKTLVKMHRLCKTFHS